jgi:hypothetical protein
MPKFIPLTEAQKQAAKQTGLAAFLHCVRRVSLAGQMGRVTACGRCRARLLPGD